MVKKFGYLVVLALIVAFGVSLSAGAAHAAGTGSVVAATGDSAVAADWKRVDDPPWCKVLKGQPAYSYKADGAKVSVPSGKRLVKYDVYPEYSGKKARDGVCKILVTEYRSHMWTVRWLQ